MRKLATLIGVFALYLLSVTSTAEAQVGVCYQDWIFYNDTVVYCENQCVVYEDPDTGATVIEDCCGGSVHISYQFEYAWICA